MSDKTMLRVHDVMRTRVDCIDGMDTIAQALDLMRQLDTKCLIVNKRHTGDEYGILLISDIARKVLAKNRSPQRINVYEVMAKPVITVEPEMDIRYCARLFDRFDLSRAPVCKNGDVVGMVSFTDLVLKGLA